MELRAGRTPSSLAAWIFFKFIKSQVDNWVGMFG